MKIRDFLITKSRVRVLGLLLALVILAACQAPPQPDTVNIAQALSSDTDAACFTGADQPAAIEFPEDRGPHPAFKTEWWYFTGNLETLKGRHFGYQLTFFRQALDCGPTEAKGSAWRFSQLYFAHFAVTDTRGGTFHSFQRMNRGSLGLAGARSGPFSVWIDDWSARETGGQIRLSARDRAGTGAVPVALDLTAIRTKPAIRQGKNGWSIKGPGPSDASYYYSFPGMETRGTITVGSEVHTLSGHSWFDHEWSTSALNREVAGWDWFAIHLADGPHRGVDLMVCQIRKDDGSPNGFGFGSLSFADGGYRILGSADFSIGATDQWTSPASGRTYPSAWTIRIPGQNLVIDLAPVLPDQEHRHMFTYYEGAVRVTAGGAGYGHVEMTGY